MALVYELQRLKRHLEDGAYRAQWEYGNDALRLELLDAADLLFEVADQVEELLTELMVKKGFGLDGDEAPAEDARSSMLLK